MNSEKADIVYHIIGKRKYILKIVANFIYLLTDPIYIYLFLKCSLNE